MSVLSVCPPCLCLRGLRLCAPYPPWPRGCSGLLQSCHFPKSLAQDCCNLVTSRSVWLRIAAILSLPEVFGSGLLQSCHFPKSLEQDCCNLVTSRRVWSRIAAILSLPEVFGSGLLQSCVSGNVWGRLSRNPAFSSPELPRFREIQEKLPEVPGALKKAFPLGCRQKGLPAPAAPAAVKAAPAVEATAEL